MALYVSAARRRRRTLVVGAAALVVGLLLGWLIGRATGSSANDDIKARQNDAEQLVARLDGLDLEYQQTAAGGAERLGRGEGLPRRRRGHRRRHRCADGPHAVGRPGRADGHGAGGRRCSPSRRSGRAPEEVSAAVARADQAVRAAAGLEQPST